MATAIPLMIPVDMIVVQEGHNARKSFDPKALKRLGKSISANGQRRLVLEPARPPHGTSASTSPAAERPRSSSSGSTTPTSATHG